MGMSYYIIWVCHIIVCYTIIYYNNSILFYSIILCVGVAEAAAPGEAQERAAGEHRSAQIRDGHERAMPRALRCAGAGPAYDCRYYYCYYYYCYYCYLLLLLVLVW